jgi:hypothetical protein
MRGTEAISVIDLIPRYDSVVRQSAYSTKLSAVFLDLRAGSPGCFLKAVMKIE